MSDIIGIDFGNKNCIISAEVNGSVDVIANQNASRATPAIVTYTNKRRFVGDLAKMQQMEFYKATITKIKSLIGMKFDSVEKKQIEPLSTVKLVELEDKYTGVSIQYNDTEIVMRPEQIVAYLLKELVKIAKAQVPNADKAVIAIPPWWTHEQRQILLNSAKISDINILGLINSTTAAAASYVKLNDDKLPPKEAKPVPIVIVDIGDFAMNVTVALIKKGYLHIVATDSDDTLGGIHFTNELLPFLLNRTQQKYNLDPRQNPRAWIRFQEAADRLKMTLSINQSVDFEISSLMNDIDVNFVVKRDDFNQLIQGLANRLHEPLLHALELANIKKEDLYAVELVGGGSRIPLIREVIFQTIGKEFPQVLNNDECFSMGCSYIAQEKIDLQDITNTEGSYKDGENADVVLFKRFSPIPASAKFTVDVEGKKKIDIKSDKGPIGEINLEVNDPAKVKVELEVSLSISSMFNVNTVSVIQEDESKPVPPVTFVYKAIGEFSDEKLKEYKDLEAKMSEDDEKENAIDNAKNELESLIFEAKNALNRDFPDNFDPASINKYKKDVEEIETWFSDNEFDRFPIEEYQKRSEAINSFFKPAQERYHLFKQLTDEITSLKDKANDLLVQVKTDAERIDGGEKEELLKQIAEFIESADKALSEPKHDEPKYKSSDFSDKLKTLETRVAARANLPLKPAPAPQKKPTVLTVDEAEEEKPEPPKAEEVPTSPKVEEPKQAEENEEEEVDEVYDFWGRPVDHRMTSSNIRRPSYVEEPHEEEEEDKTDYDDYIYDSYGNVVGRRDKQMNPRCKEVVCEDNDGEEYYENPLATLLGCPQKKKKQSKKKEVKKEAKKEEVDEYERLLGQYREFGKKFDKEMEDLRRKAIDIKRREIELAKEKEAILGKVRKLRNTKEQMENELYRAQERKRRAEMMKNAYQNYMNTNGGEAFDFLGPTFQSLFQQAFRDAAMRQQQQQQPRQQTQQNQNQPRSIPGFRGPFYSPQFGYPIFF
ncbi:dnaK protein [Trichomonas vaginalis G3]|uniref:DnaK protein n=1 Tax=Trichomonas vaginalis (strain ATCC PRA-98 / G3) TaxID=412133 RepID=A2F0R7_TRIV3|nr:dnaK protein [Trichomonas vaginalis G3]|eukprot:XP_001314197.1 dnaK protein [Trichomonas vaginalis G3]